ncbi:MAG: endolytic transglycosylase MltG [Thermodesulfobacteriota bacterium]
MQRTFTIFVTGFLVVILCAFAALYFGYFLVSPAGRDKQEEVFLVEKGSGLRSIAAQLEERGLIKSKYLFMLWAYMKGCARDIQAGEYSFNQSLAPVQILGLLTSGKVKTYSFTIPEGLTSKEIADLLEERDLVNKRDFISLISDKDLVASYHVDGPSLEGYLFPDTYVIRKDMEPHDLIGLMVNRFWEVFNSLIEEKKPEMPVRDIVILASIVEKETGLAEERPLIAAVFLNRLKKKMRLESDPTVIYGLENFQGNLTRKNLQASTPYNTYVQHGLPPGPIANSGREALKAVINPAETDYLYFVSKNDGSHHFSATLKEHNRAVYTYQKKQQR